MRREAAGKYLAQASNRKTDKTLTDGFTPPGVKRDLNCVVCVHVAVSLVISCVLCKKECVSLSPKNAQHAVLCLFL